MVTIGSPFSGSTFSRVSSVLARNVVLSNLGRNQREMLRLQEQLSSGFLINRPSDDPIGANRVIDFTAGISRNETFLRNIQAADGRLAMSEGALASATGVLTRLQVLFHEQRGGTADAQSRRQAADEVTLLLQDAVRQANLRFEGRALFGGSRTDRDPFTLVADGVVFNGDLEALRADVSDGIRMVTNVSGDAFGALSDEIRGLDPATLLPIDLDPRASPATRLTDLNQGRGVALGSVGITVGLTTTVVDLRIAQSVGDVVDLINDAATGVTAAFNAATNTFEFTSGSAFSIGEVSNGSTGLDLGILVAGGPGTVAGAVLDPALTKETLLGDLFGGAGIDSSGMVLANQTSGQTYTATLGAAVFAGTSTVEQVLNAINASGAYVHARIDGRGISVVSRLSGGRLTIAENGGTTADDLGLLSTLARARITDLNGGLGVDTVAGPDLKITKKDGTTLLIDVDNAVTVQDLLNAIDADPDLTAAIVGGQIEVTDTTAPAGTLSIEDVSPGFAATQLGIRGSVTGAGPQTITGTGLTFAGAQVDGLFTSLLRLRDALLADDPAAMDAAFRASEVAREKLLDARGEVGARVAGLELTRNRLDLEKTELEKLRGSTQDVDIAEAATRFQIQSSILQASLAAAARILETSLLNFLSR